MPQIENKITFGIESAHYALITNELLLTYATPVKLLGAVSLKASPTGSVLTKYADNGVYIVISGNTGHEIELELQNIDDATMVELFGQTITAVKKLLVETADIVVKKFALLGEISGDAYDRPFVYYCCTFERPEFETKTTEEGVDSVTVKLKGIAMPITDPTYGKKIIKSSCTKDTPADAKAAWYTAVVRPDATV